MTKNFKFGLISFVGLAVICGLLYYLIGPSQKVDPEFDADTDIKNGTIQLITYGFDLPPPSYVKISKQVDSVAISCGFKWDNRGCMPPENSDSLVGQYNKKVIKYLSARNGQGWFDKYKKTVDSLYNSVTIINKADSVK